MAQPTQTLNFICRSCRHTLFRTTTQIRAFSSSAPHSKSIPTFMPSSSPELDAILLDWRNRVFKPSALSQQHQHLIYRKKNAHILDNDPGVLVTMSNNEEVKLEQTVRFDRPRRQASLNQIAKILSENKDITAWDNLPSFLEGMLLSKEPVPVAWLEKVTRKANEVGRAGVVKRCAEMVKKTGVKLAMKPVTRELMLGYHNRAVQAGFKGESLKGICAEAESLALLLEKPEHCSGTLAAEEHDMRKDLLVLGILLELSAAKAISTHASQDAEGTVSRHVKTLLTLAEQDGTIQEYTTGRSPAIIERLLPLTNGIRLASRIVDLSIDMNQQKTMRAMLRDFDEIIEKETDSINSQNSGKPKRALLMIEQLEEASQI